MIEIISFDNEKVIGLKVSGKIQADGIEDVKRVIDEKLEKYEKLNVYVEFAEVLDMSSEAFYKDLKFSFSHFGDFEKEAVVSDKKWLDIMISVVDKLTPSLEVRHFSRNEIEAAKAWIQK